MTEGKLYEYYARQDLLPTFGNFRDEGDLERYAAQRRRLFTDKLALPVALFRDTSLIEFGPDSGENAMTFARWGANLTLVEPNERSLGQIRAYFARFGLEAKLQALVQSDVESYAGTERFDIVDAEGFIYTVQPAERWLGMFHRILEPEGFAVLSYYERSGALFELALRAIHAAGKAFTGKPPRAVADLLFASKWNSVPHTRSIDSWIMDVLENPFVRLRYFLDAEDLCTRAHASGFSVHASWPAYHDALAVSGHKKIPAPLELLSTSLAHIRRSRLGFAAGRKLFLTGADDAVIAVGQAIDKAVIAVDGLIDDPIGLAGAARVRVDSLRDITERASVLVDHDDDLFAYRAALDALEQVLAAIDRRDMAAITLITGSNPAFIAEWGLPAHFLVLRKRVG